MGQIEEDVVSDNKPEGLWDKITDTFKPKVTDIQNEETGDISSLVKTARENTAVKFFLNVGYTEKQAIGITAGLSKVSGMITGITPRSKGIGAYNDRRYNDLLRFSNDSNEFLTQLSFVAYELNGTQSSANIRLLQSDRLDNNGICHIVGKYYLGRASIVKQIELTARRLTDRIV